MKLKFILLISLATIVIACQSDSDIAVLQEKEPPASISRQDIVLTSAEKQLSEQANIFAFKLLKTVYKDKDGNNTNILLSPLSATLAFSMLNNGAVGTTGEEIRQTLGFGNVSSEAINVYAQKIINAMRALDPQGVFESANSIWIQQNFPVLDAFKQVNQQYYDAEIQNVDFRKPATLKLINDWASEKTHGKIPEILKEIDPLLTRLILCNALYFKGYWKEPFDKKCTFDAQFLTSSGTAQVVPTMKKSFLSNYVKFGNCSAVELPFGNGAFSLVVVLPDEGADMQEITEHIDYEWWKNITDFEKVAIDMHAKNQVYALNLEIPRFKLEYERTLNNDLMVLGMQTPFDKDVADFSLITQDTLFISNVTQKTFARMDEDGMEAAAVTVIAMLGSSNFEYIPIDFKVNRPFLYFLKEKSTGLVFFAGVMNKIT